MSPWCVVGPTNKTLPFSVVVPLAVTLPLNVEFPVVVNAPAIDTFPGKMMFDVFWTAVFAKANAACV